jgi:hypothetical protein
MSVLKLTIGVPAVLASAVLWMVGLALLPPVVALLAFLVGVVLLGLLAAGVGERTGVRVLAGARPATPGDEAALIPLVQRLGALDVARDREVLVRRSVGPQTPPAQLLGRGALVVTPWLIEAQHRGWLTLDEAVALVVHADARRHAENPRAEAAMLALTLPYRAVGALGLGIVRAFAWVPLMRFAWALRGVVAAVAVAQQVAVGRALLGILVGTIVALTHLIPAASRGKAARVEAAADAVVVRLGLGSVFALVMRRYRLPMTLERWQLLQVPPPAGGLTQMLPRLELVHR